MTSRIVFLLLYLLANPYFGFCFYFEIGLKLLDSRAADTACKYSNGWQRGKTQAQSKLGVPVLPPVPLQVALYLAKLVERAVLKGHFAYVIESASCSTGLTYHLPLGEGRCRGCSKETGETHSAK